MLAKHPLALQTRWTLQERLAVRLRAAVDLFDDYQQRNLDDLKQFTRTVLITRGFRTA